jgi:hypothetical protein
MRNVELHILYSAPNIMWVIKSRKHVEGHVTNTEKWRGSDSFGGKTRGKRPFERPRLGW